MNGETSEAPKGRAPPVPTSLSQNGSEKNAVATATTKRSGSGPMGNTEVDEPSPANRAHVGQFARRGLVVLIPASVGEINKLGR